MKLRSDNVGSKTPKHSSFPITNEIKQNEEEEDIISRLPDEILTHILSLLPDADAHRCRILSNRWSHLFFFLPSLCFEMPPSYDEEGVEDVNKFYDFVDKTFSLRNRDMPVIKRFFLSCSKHYDHNRILDWLIIVLGSKLVETLELRFPCHKDRFGLSWDLLVTCNSTLLDLTLEDVTMVALDEIQCLFPCLKRLKLASIKYSGDESPQNLISACPVLQELFLVEQKLPFQLQTFEISSSSLKRLRIKWCAYGYRKFVIDAPKLEYFYIGDDRSATYSFTNPMSLVEAHIDIYFLRDIQLLTKVSSARILTLGSDSLLGLHHNPGLNMPVFSNFVKFLVDFEGIKEWDTLFILLKSMPNLQHITIDFGHHLSPFRRRWNRPTEAPACLHIMVKDIVILNHNVAHMKDHVTLIRYLLNHSSVLEKLTLSTNDIDRETCEELLKIRRRSKSCQIVFN